MKMQNANANAIGHERPDAGESDKDIKTVNRSASTYERKERGVPEFQLANEQSVVGYVNFMYGVIANGVGDVKTDYAAILAKAPDSAALVSEVNLLLAAGQLSDATVQTIRSAVDSIAASDTKGAINRVGVAILLTVASPEFMVVR